MKRSSEFRSNAPRSEANDAVVRGIAPSSRSFRDDTVEPDATYEYTWSPWSRRQRDVLAADPRHDVESRVTLFPNAPNPFNPSTTIRYMLPSRERVRVTIYDVSGRLITTLVDRDQAAGSYDVEWKGLDAVGTRVSSGVYLVQIEAGKQSLSRKMVLLK